MKPFQQKPKHCPIPIPSKRQVNYCNKQKEGMIAGLYDLGETIGKGHYAVVKLARHVFTGEKVAVKVIDKSKLDNNSKAHLFQEVRCMKLVQHENVVKLYQVIDTQTKLYLILEFADGGDMYDYIMKHDKGLTEDQARHYFSQIVNAIDFCHKLHVVHRDLKPENVVFFKSLNSVKLTDFGFSNKFVPGNKLDTSCGSLAYSAPEILLGDSYDAPAVDIWSLGVILYMLVCGEAPFHEANDSETLTMIMDCRYNIPSYLSHSCKDLIGKMLVREPTERAKLNEIFSHPWLAEGNTSRITELPLICQEVLSHEDHNAIVEKMISGNFATLQEITESLREEAYDHITATYYLLAERLLKRRRVGFVEINSAMVEFKPVLSPLALSPRTSNSSCDIGKNSIAEYLERSRMQFECLVSPPSSRVSPSNSSYFLNNLSLEDDNPCENSIKKDQLMQQTFRSRGTPPPSLSPSVVPYPIGLMGNVTTVRPLFTVQSSPQLLNEICEEEESDVEDNSREASLTTLNQTISRKTNGNRNKNLENMRRKKLSSRSRGASNISSSEDVSESEEQKHQNNPRRAIVKCRVQGCARNDLTRRDSSEHSSDTDGTGGFLGKGRVMINDRYHHHYQAQHRQRQNNCDSQSSNRQATDTKRCHHAKDTLTDNSDNISEVDYDAELREDLESKEPQVNLLKAALRKLNVSFNEQDEHNEDGRNKLSSVVEENFNHSSLSSSSSLSISSDAKFSGRRATSLMNISNIRWNSLKFLDLSSPKITEKCFLEGMMMMVWDDQENEEIFRKSSSTNLKNACLYKSMDANLHDETTNFSPLIRNWRFSLDRNSLNVSSFA